MARITNPAVELMWIARLLDSCCAGGYGPIAASRAATRVGESSRESSTSARARTVTLRRSPGEDRQLVGSSQR